MYYNKSVDDLEKELKTNSKGLTKKQVLERQEKYGKNLYR